MVYALDCKTGVEVARRVLPDPVPVAALAVDGGLVHVVATRKGEPIFWYALSSTDLVPRHRRIIAIPPATRHDDVLDAWASPDGGLWFELVASIGRAARNVRSYVFADPAGAAHEVATHEVEATGDGPASARNACAGGLQLFAPIDGKWTGGDGPLAPALSLLDPRPPEQSASGEPPWARATLVGPRARIHAVGGEGVVCGVAAAEDPDKPERARIEMFAVDRLSGVVRWRAQADRIAIKSHLGDAVRVARRPNGELLFQSLGSEGSPRTPLLCARPEGRIDEILLGARGRWVLDAALGDLVLAHREESDGGVEVGGFAIDQEGRLLGRRAVARWSIDAGDLGGGTTVYAGAGAVVVRGATAVCAVWL